MSILLVPIVPVYLGYRVLKHQQDKKKRELEFKRKCWEIDRKRRQVRYRKFVQVNNKSLTINLTKVIFVRARSVGIPGFLEDLD